MARLLCSRSLLVIAVAVIVVVVVAVVIVVAVVVEVRVLVALPAVDLFVDVSRCIVSFQISAIRSKEAGVER